MWFIWSNHRCHCGSYRHELRHLVPPANHRGSAVGKALELESGYLLSNPRLFIHCRVPLASHLSPFGLPGLIWKMGKLLVTVAEQGFWRSWQKCWVKPVETKGIHHPTGCNLKLLTQKVFIVFSCCGHILKFKKKKKNNFFSIAVHSMGLGLQWQTWLHWRIHFNLQGDERSNGRQTGTWWAPCGISPTLTRHDASLAPRQSS